MMSLLSNTTVFVAALILAMVFAVVLALVIETAEIADEPQSDGRR
jgi:hypothetical protein